MGLWGFLVLHNHCPPEVQMLKMHLENSPVMMWGILFKGDLGLIVQLGLL